MTTQSRCNLPCTPSKFAEADLLIIRNERDIIRLFGGDRVKELCRCMSRIFACRGIPLEHRTLPLVLTEQSDAANSSLGFIDDSLQDVRELIGHSRHHRWIEEFVVIFERTCQSLPLDDLEREIQFGHTRVGVHVLNLEAGQLRHLMPEILKHEHDLKDWGMVAGSRTTHIRHNPLERNMLVLKSVK